MKLFSLHTLGLAVAIALGAALRFWNLDVKPLWLDETITALASLGRSYNEIPLGMPFSLSTLKQIFTLQSAATCPQISQIVITQSNHPPLFFCLEHAWLNWLGFSVWNLRALPALMGVVGIAALYCLNRLAFSPAAGLMGAAIMAVSPFGVYLSQEARHYTLPIVLITLALFCLVLIQQDLKQRQRVRTPIWLGWMAINSLGFYIHYFCILAFVAQVITLICLFSDQRQTIPFRQWKALGLATGGVICSHLLWLPVLLDQRDRPGTDWINFDSTSWFNYLEPVARILAGLSTMTIILPIESQPSWIVIPVAVVMVLFVTCLGWWVFQGLKQLWFNPETRLPTLILISFTSCALLENLAFPYILHQDITIGFRYNFTYYPGVCALLGASLVSLPSRYLKPGKDLVSYYFRISRQRQIQILVLLVGILSSTFVVFDLAFQKPFYLEQAARKLILADSTAQLTSTAAQREPILVAMAYNNFLDVVIGLSYALEIHKIQLSSSQPDTNVEVYLTFLKHSQGIETFRTELLRNRQRYNDPLKIWLVGPQLFADAKPLIKAPAIVSTLTTTGCTPDPGQSYASFGVPFQLYRCPSKPRIS